MTTTNTTNRFPVLSARERVMDLGQRYDMAVESAMENAYDLGLREDGEDDGAAFWEAVWGQVMA